MVSTIKQILDQGYFDAAEEIEGAIILDSIAEKLSAGDAVALRDAAIDIRYLIGLVQDFSKSLKVRHSKASSSTAQVFYKLSDVVIMLQLSTSSIYRMVKIVEFPKQIKISERASGWLKVEVDEWVENKIKERK